MCDDRSVLAQKKEVRSFGVHSASILLNVCVFARKQYDYEVFFEQSLGFFQVGEVSNLQTLIIEIVLRVIRGKKHAFLMGLSYAKGCFKT